MARWRRDSAAGESACVFGFAGDLADVFAGAVDVADDVDLADADAEGFDDGVGFRLGCLGAVGSELP